MACLVLACLPATARAGTLVNLEFAGFGSVQIDLFDDLTPLSVANLLQYINANRYDDSIIHRVDTGLGVIQGGGFDTQGTAIPAFSSIVNEYSRANTRGTISMARQSDPNSATSQWFINTVDNTVNLGQSNGGGYAVFGWVVGPGMSVVDSIAAVPTFPFGSPFNQVPLTNYTQADFNANPKTNPLPHLVVLTSATVVGTHPAFTNPYLSNDVDNNAQIQPLDALLIINDIIAHNNQQHNVVGPFSGTAYLDTSGDGKVGPIDALRVINALIAQGGGGGGSASQSLAEPSIGISSLSSPMTSIVPEPASWAMAVTGALALGGYALMRRRRARQSFRLPA